MLRCRERSTVSTFVSKWHDHRKKHTALLFLGSARFKDVYFWWRAENALLASGASSEASSGEAVPDGSENPLLASGASSGLRVKLQVFAPFQSQLYVGFTPLTDNPKREWIS